MGAKFPYNKGLGDIVVRGKGLVVKGLQLVEILTNFHENTSTYIIDHIEEWHKQHALYKINIKNEFILGWFMKYFISITTKDMTMTMLQYQEETIVKAQQFDIFYSQSRYMYTIIPH